MFNKYYSPKAFLENPLGYGHSYSPAYFELVKHLRGQQPVVLEIGIGHIDHMGEWGTLFPLYRPGASLKAWRDFFGSSARVYGIDNDPKTIFSEGNIRCFIGDQSKEESLEAAIGKMGELWFDLIVEDGMGDKLTPLKTLIKYVRPGGLYITEDVHDWQMGKIKDAARPLADLLYEHMGNFFWDNFLAFTPKGSIATE